ncbi:CD2 antigen cytoplasmic tail-binding protein 2 [Thelohanellus kitauei]|uniref:CD2 antigen cytoplasmic tail-binding protein 2 n=1 Tax=Thelohanellus kitauei TaxID=669202 RepID=A0A0C2MCV0_THEKT|nr:CD2 antigen cytoplasmic tail-binding protein 2 [Thelohanellus kitauei]
MTKRVKFSDEVTEHLIDRSGYSDPDHYRDNHGTKEDGIQDLDDEDQMIKYLGKRSLRIEEIEGQEETTELGYDDVKITPFNLQEEYQEGHFDRSGNFIFDKNDEKSRDAWLDSIEWDDVKEIEEVPEIIDQPPKYVDKVNVIKNILKIINLDESVLSALKRLNRQRNESEKSGNDSSIILEQINELTGLADELLEEDGETYHKLGQDLQKEIQDEPMQTKKWYFKWRENSEAFGPYETNQMLTWNKAGFFHSGIFCKCLGFFDDQFVRSETLDFSSFM